MRRCIFFVIARNEVAIWRLNDEVPKESLLDNPLIYFGDCLPAAGRLRPAKAGLAMTCNVKKVTNFLTKTNCQNDYIISVHF